MARLSFWKMSGSGNDFILVDNRRGAVPAAAGAALARRGRFILYGGEELMYKTHTCGELRLSHAGQPVTLAGWVHRRRDHGGVTFIDLRDRPGLIQVVADQNTAPDAHATLQAVRMEWVLQVIGLVRKRLPGMENPKLPTGEIEIEVIQVKILNAAKPLPFMIAADDEIDEQTRLRYRYLDLRRERMRRNLELRHRVVKYIRDYLDRYWCIVNTIS